MEKRNKRILILCPAPEGYVPAQRLKFEQYYQYWRSNGYDVDVSSFMSEGLQQIVYTKGNTFKKIAGTVGGYIRRIAGMFTIRRYDLVYVFLWVTPFGAPFSEWLVRRLSKRMIYDIDDLVYKAESSPNNKYVKYLKSGSKVDFLLKHADHVLVSTDKLLQYAQQFNTRVSSIPATIDVEKYNVQMPLKTDKVTIGWSGSHTTSKYLHLLDNVLRSLSQKQSIRIMVMGDKSFKIDNLDVEIIDWSAEKEIENLLKFDIGLHPLPDEEWVYGKSGGKLVQYMAAGIPIVASAIGPNFKAIKEGYNGFLVNTDEEWVAKLELLINDVAMRKQMGLNSKKLAVEVYSVQANAHKYLSVINAL